MSTDVWTDGAWDGEDSVEGISSEAGADDKGSEDGVRPLIHSTHSLQSVYRMPLHVMSNGNGWYNTIQYDTIHYIMIIIMSVKDIRLGNK